MGFLCLVGGFNSALNNTSRPGPEAPMLFLAAGNDELLDQIFEEEKSDRVCRFLKNRKLKA